ncbi:MAG: ABC transporter ATP-binding protein [Propionibacteriaceae bacterium]|jgi:putative ABC transport system ATP-binding protein|nr:ABC transporter ATP-binding protein [Propionibacteriaceae bacterium]
MAENHNQRAMCQFAGQHMVDGMTATYDPTALPSPAATAPHAAAVRARGLSRVFGQGEAAVHALRDVDVDFAAGEFTAIMGPSGSGKSTLLYLLAGLETQTAGHVELAGQTLTSLSDNELTILRRDRVGFVFQSFNLLPMFTAKENILLPAQLAGRKADPKWFDTIITTLGLGGRLDHRPSELSGGQAQRVAIARAMIMRPEVIFADEPTGNLDSRSGLEVLGFLRHSVRQLGQTVVMVTHDPVAAAHASRVVLLADGRLAGEICDPTPESILASLDALRPAAL